MQGKSLLCFWNNIITHTFSHYNLASCLYDLQISFLVMYLYLFNFLHCSEMLCAMTLSLQSGDWVGTSWMRQKLHLSITARTVLSDVASPATSEERNEKESKPPSCGPSAKRFTAALANISRCLGAGLSIFIGLPILHTASGQRIHGFFCQIYLFLAKMNLKELRTASC